MDVLENNNLFKKLKFVQCTSMALDIDRVEFKKLFNEFIGQEVGYFGLSNHKKELHGEIKNRTFKIHRSTSMTSDSGATAQGEYEEIDGTLQIEITVFIPMSTFLIFGLGLIAFGVIITVLSIAEDAPIGVAIFFLSALLYLSVRLYFSFRKNVKELHNRIEREFGYWLAKSKALQIII